MAAKTWTQTSGNNWSTGANWNGGTVPVTTDTITFDATSTANCTIDNVGTWSGGTFTVTSGYTGTITKSVAMTTAAFAMQSGCTATFTDSSGASMTCTSLTVTAATAFTATSGTLTVTSTYDMRATTFTHNSGTLHCNGTLSPVWDHRSAAGLNLVTISKTSGTLVLRIGTWPLGNNPTTTCGTGAINAQSSGGSGTISATGTWSHTGGLLSSASPTFSGMSAINVTEGNVGFNTATIPSGLNITMTITSSTARSFTGASQTYGTFYRTGVGSGTLTITGSNTFAQFKDNDGSVAHSILFTAGTTQTVSSFVVDGSSGKLVTIGSPTAAAHTLTTTGGSVSCTYLSVSFSTVDVSPTWTADVNSTDGGNNTNWIFAGAPTGHPTVKRVAGVPFAQHRVVGRAPIRMWKHSLPALRAERIAA